MKSLSCFAKGFRTFLAALAFIVTGLLGVMGALDLSPVVALFFDDPKMLAAAMVMVGILFGFLRTLSSTPVFTSQQPRRMHAPTNPGTPDSDSDDVEDNQDNDGADVPLKSNIEAGE